MENINFICGKTKDGNPITLDGFRGESFAVYTFLYGTRERILRGYAGI